MPIPTEQAYADMISAEARQRALSASFAGGAIDPWTGRETVYNASAARDAVAQAALIRENRYNNVQRSIGTKSAPAGRRYTGTPTQKKKNRGWWF